MKYGDLTINGKDAFLTWGIGLGEGSLAALMTPAGVKEFVQYNSRMQHGKRVIDKAPRVADRDVTIMLHLVAPTPEDFLQQYADFCQELATGVLHIQTKHQPGVVYRCTYVSCTQFGVYSRGLAKFTLRLNEPNPTDREAISTAALDEA